MPKGTRHRATQLAEKLMGDAEDIVRAVISSAKAGDPTAMRLCIERLIPVREGRPVAFDLPNIEAASDITKALGLIAKSLLNSRRKIGILNSNSSRVHRRGCRQYPQADGFPCQSIPCRGR
jgi:hypothetical protein